MDKHQQLAHYLEQNPQAVSNVVDIDRTCDRLLPLDFTANNTELKPETIADTLAFTQWVTQKLEQHNCRYGIGGYMEHRTLYARSQLFNVAGQQPRRLHLGVDIWGAAQTPLYAPLKGTVHSFQNNNNFGDYGPTIILQHDLDGLTLYSLYGHLSTDSLSGLSIGKPIAQGQQIATLGDIHENGSWPPHLHFQLMLDMQGRVGDYPGVCSYDEKDIYQQKIPDPELILGFAGATIM